MTGLIFGVFMTEWTMVQAKRDFSAGLLRGFHFDQVPGGWSLQLQGAAGLGTGFGDWFSCCPARFGFLSGRRVKEPWNKWRGLACGEETVYAAKVLDSAGAVHASPWSRRGLTPPAPEGSRRSARQAPWGARQ